jgi:hypothetical protein
MQSIAQHFELKALVNGSDEYRGKLEPIQPVLQLPMPNGKTISFFGNDALYNKALTPIQVGGVVVGILLYLFDVPRAVFENHKTVFTLSFSDALYKIYNVEIPLGTMPVGDIDYVPGLTMVKSKTPAETPRNQ